MEPLPGRDRGLSLPPSPCWVTGLPWHHPQGPPSRGERPSPAPQSTFHLLAQRYPGWPLPRWTHPWNGLWVPPSVQGSHWALGMPSTPLRLPCLQHAPWLQSPEVCLIISQGAKTNREEQQLSRLEPSALHKLEGDGSRSARRSYIQVPRINADTDL